MTIYGKQHSDGSRSGGQPVSKADDVPDWAVKRALQELNVLGQPVCHVVKAFARYIAAHEPEPVDPLREIASAVEAAWLDAENGTFLGDLVYAELRARGVTAPQAGGGS